MEIFFAGRAWDRAGGRSAREARLASRQHRGDGSFGFCGRATAPHRLGGPDRDRAGARRGGGARLRPGRLPGLRPDAAVRRADRRRAPPGRAGAPCACFGPRSKVSWLGVLRNLALAAAFGLGPAGRFDHPLAPRPGSGSASGSRCWRAPASSSRCWRWRARSGCCGCSSAPRGPWRSRGRGPTSALGPTHSRGASPCRRRAPFKVRARRLQLRGLPPLPDALAGDRERRQGPPGHRRRLRRGRRGGALARPRDPGQPVRRSPSTRRHRPRQGDVQQPRPARERAGHRASGAVPEHLDRARATRSRGTRSRRGFLARVGGALVASDGGPDRRHADRARRLRGLPLLRAHLHHRLLPAPDRAAADRLPRLSAAGQRRPCRRRHRPAGERRRPAGGRRRELLRDPEGRPLPRRPARGSATGRATSTASAPTIDGSWFRCCGGKVRQLRDCCAHHSTRINGDAALTGYCFGGRKVFCVQYYDTKVPC